MKKNRRKYKKTKPVNYFQPNACANNTQSTNEKLELHLHEQYAINNNAGLANIATFLVTLFAAFGAYGYVYIHLSPLFCDTNECGFTVNALIIAACAVVVVLWAMCRLCIYQGSQQRIEQFMIHAIRCKHMTEEDMKSIFPSKYTPFCKTKSDFVQGVFGELLTIFKYTACLLVASLILSIFMHEPCICCNLHPTDIYCSVFFLAFVLAWQDIKAYANNRYSKYKETELEFRIKNKHPNNNKQKSFKL